MIGANKKKSDFATPYTVSNALTKGGAAVKLSALIMGLGNIAHKQIIKGLIFLAIEIGYIMFMVNAGAYYLSMLPSLGWRKQEEVFNEQKQIYEYVQGDNSVLLLLYGVATIAITLLFIYMWAENLRSAYMAECLAKEGKEINSFGKDVKSLFDKFIQDINVSPIDGNSYFYSFTIVIHDSNGIYQLFYDQQASDLI